MFRSKLFWALVVCIIAIGALGLYQVHKLNVAHSTFENYYAFRGCTQLIDKTATSADCALANGQQIKIVLYEGRWFLDGDLPCKTGICW